MRGFLLSVALVCAALLCEQASACPQAVQQVCAVQQQVVYAQPQLQAVVVPQVEYQYVQPQAVVLQSQAVVAMQPQVLRQRIIQRNAVVRQPIIRRSVIRSRNVVGASAIVY